MENLKEIGERIKKVRKELGLTQEDMAKKLGMSRNSIIRYENGEAVPSRKFLKLLEYEFGINPRWILKGEGEMFLPSDYEKKKQELTKKGKIILRSENKNFKDIVIDPRDFEIYIKGKVEALYLKF